MFHYIVHIKAKASLFLVKKVILCAPGLLFCTYDPAEGKPSQTVHFPDHQHIAGTRLSGNT